MNDRSWLRRPEEGWLTVALVAIMAVVLAWAIDEPSWVDGKGAMTDNLPILALLGALAGFIGPKVGWGRWTTHAIGAVFAALIVPIVAGWAIQPGASVADAFRATASGSVEAYLDVAWRGRQFTSQEVHYVLVLGSLVWATAQFSAYAVFGHRRPLNAVVVMGLVLLANISLTSRDQLPHLVAFTGASLFLLIGMHVFDERTTWLRRRIGDPGTVSSLYLRGGTVFIVVTLIGSLLLTQRAASAPLAGAWESVDDQLIALADTIGRYFPNGGDFRGGGGINFGASARISGQWITDTNVAFRATVPAGEDNLYWRAATYDRFALEGWEQSGVHDTQVASHGGLLDGTPEQPDTSITREITVTVQPDDYRDSLMLSPATAIGVDRDATVRLQGDGNWFADVDVGAGRAPYTVTARIMLLGTGLGVTGNQLRAASENYPTAVSDEYTSVPAGAIGPDAAEVLAQVKARAKSADPYDLATAMVSFLQDTNEFQYNADVRALACDTASRVECFARTRQGYCLHYASMMAILLRAANPDNRIPTRLVQGFLPSKTVGTSVTILNSNAHAWVEVYFPGYGWIPFDPTGGGRSQQASIPDGPPVASATPGPSSNSASPRASRDIFDPEENRGGAGPITGGSNRSDPTLLYVSAILLAIIVGSLVLVAWIRGPRGEINPDTAWLSMSRIASRLGFGPRPTQTVYEYAATLGDLVPTARPDLQTVANAKVEVAYARASLGGDRLAAVGAATRRLRVTLLRLVARRLARFRRR